MYCSGSKRKQTGSALIVSIFVVVVMGVMAAAMIKIDWGSQTMTTKEVLATRAWFTANSGNEMMLNSLFPIGQSGADSTACTTGVSFAPANHYHCRAVIDCQAGSVSHAGSTITMYYLESSATCGSGSEQVTRIQETWAKDLANNE